MSIEEVAVSAKVLSHIAIGKEVEETIRRYWTDLGIGPWKIQTHGPGLEEVTYRGKECPRVVKVAVAELDRIYLRLEQPISGPMALRDFLDKNGQGIWNICLLVDDLASSSAEMQRLWYRVLETEQGLGPSRDGEAAYFDTESAMGIVIKLATVVTDM
jgi:methylmalonyl-CoA/ethylmalonyl-CoA epimerase